MAEDRLDLASEFPAASDADWRTAVEKALGGRPFEKVMQAESYDGIPLHALYTADSATVEPQPSVREGAWQIIAPHWNPDTAATNAAILNDLERGATGISLRLSAGTMPGVAPSDLPAALKGVYLNMAELHLLPGEAFESASHAALDLFGAGGHPADEIRGSLGIDPVGTLAQTGRLLTGASDALTSGAKIAEEVAARYTHVTSFTADGSIYHTAGATEAQELGLTLATAAAYLRSMEAVGMSLADAFRQIRITLAADADLFLTMAKFRAMRRLWAHMGATCGEKCALPAIGAVSALRMYSVCDPWVNILRGTAACFAAGVGGADSITILPHDTMLGLSSRFARRIARNIQVILQEESNLSRVSDPAAGSFAVESITSEISDKAWKYFQKIESSGGVVAALKSGLIHVNLADSWDARAKNIARRKEPVTGVSEFPDIFEKPIDGVEPAPGFNPNVPPAGVTVDPLPFHRSAGAFEALRAKSDGVQQDRGRRPQVFLANLGPVAAHTARATFAKNFFEAGGIEALPSAGFDDADSIAAAFADSGADVAVICGRDEDYGSLGQNAAKALKSQGCCRVYLAGRPKDVAPYEAAGVDDFIYLGCDVIETLETAFKAMGGKS